MINFQNICLILFLHWIADFILQTDWMAQNKSTSNKALLIHVSVYTLPFLFIGWKFALLNSVIHFCVDYITSRIAKKFYNNGDIHNFFVIVGFDQTIHFITLFGLYMLGIR